jgi:hypothetical protein
VLIDILAEELVDGWIAVDPREDIAAFKTRLFSEDGHQRVARLDNLKTHKFSWDQMESLMTAGTISGKKLYMGAGRRPNTLTWMITLNGASLSKDVASRSIVIVLDRPPQVDAEWEDDVRTFIRANRPALLAEIRDLILAPPPDTFRAGTRWGPWEKAILSKLKDPAKILETIIHRRKSLDVDEAARNLFIDKVIEELKRYGHDPETAVVLIPVADAALWLCQVERQPMATGQATAAIKIFSIPNLQKSDRGDGRYWVWRGKKAKPGQPSVPFTPEGARRPSDDQYDMPEFDRPDNDPGAPPDDLPDNLMGR